MPTLTRLSIVVVVVVAIVIGVVVSLANFVELEQRELTIRIPAKRLAL
jgi:hypothetical protein